MMIIKLYNIIVILIIIKLYNMKIIKLYNIMIIINLGGSLPGVFDHRLLLADVWQAPGVKCFNV